MADVAASEDVDRARGAAADPLDLRVRRHRRARGDAAASRHGRGRRRRHHRGGDRARHRARVLAAARVRGRSTDNIIGLVYLKDLVRRARAGEGDQPGAGRGAPGDLRPRAETGGGAAPRDADQAVPHGHRHRRARRHVRAGHPRGPARGDRGRDRRRVRRRDARGGAAGRRVAAGAGTHAGRRGERGARHRAARRGVGHRRRPDPQPPRPRARRRRDGAVPGSGVPHRAGAGPSHRRRCASPGSPTPSPTHRTSSSTKPPKRTTAT